LYIVIVIQLYYPSGVVSSLYNDID